MEYKVVQIESLEMLSDTFDELKQDNFVFRGQTVNYPTFMTSFDRQGCLPPLMIKWTYYARELIRVVCGQEVDSVEVMQAILQHYGWRSFFIDITTSIDVAAWFACHEYVEQPPIIEMKEDFEESPIYEVAYTATYTESVKEYSFIYVFDREGMSSDHTLTFIDLTKAGVFSDGMRPLRQEGCLYGGFSGNLMASKNQTFDENIRQKLVCTLQVKTIVLLKYITVQGLSKDYLFPSPNEDALYGELLNLPRKKLEDDFFVPTLKIPDYHHEFHKWISSNRAYCDGRWISDRIFPQLPDGTYVFKVPEHVLFLSSPVIQENIARFFQEYSQVLIEFDMIQRTFEEEPSAYTKGIHCYCVDGLVYVAELIVEQRGNVISGVAENAGTYHELRETGFLEVPRADSCPCNNPDRHTRNLNALVNFVNLFFEGELALNDKN